MKGEGDVSIRSSQLPLPNTLGPAIPPDGRQSPTALAVARGTARLLHSLGLSCVSELPLPGYHSSDRS